MDILLLGGTGFLGREVARQLITTGHSVTCVARGSGHVPAGAVLIKADRDQPDSLETVAGRDWGAVIDVATHPSHARRAAQRLTAKHWVYVSSGSVYTHFDATATTEMAEVHDALEAEVMGDMSQYGPAKVACEEAYRDHHKALTIIRPGLIGGNGDWTGRSGYYPWRFAHPTGNDVLVPDATQPTAILDVADLAGWIVHCVVNRICGTFNIGGEATTLGEVYAHCVAITGSSAQARVVDDTMLLKHGVRPWKGPRSLPLWIPDPALRYMSILDCSKAKLQGFSTRPMEETLAAAQRYEESRQDVRQVGLSDDEERELRNLIS